VLTKLLSALHYVIRVKAMNCVEQQVGRHCTSTAMLVRGELCAAVDSELPANSLSLMAGIYLVYVWCKRGNREAGWVDTVFI
jgi:hypothetical protein